MSRQFKVNNKNNRMTLMTLFCFYCYLRTDFTYSSSVSIVDFQQLLLLSYECSFMNCAFNSILKQLLLLSYECSFMNCAFNSILTLSWQWSLSYRNQYTNLLCKSIDLFLNDRNFHHERVNNLMVQSYLTFLPLACPWFWLSCHIVVYYIKQ